MDIEGCHRLPLGRNTTSTTKRVIVKFVNRKHSEAMLQRKKDINSKNKVFVTHSLCPYYCFLWGKCKDLQRKDRISQVFCLGAVVTIRVTENSPAIKILHERDLIVYQECPLDSVWKIISFFWFCHSYCQLQVICKPLTDGWRRPWTDYCQLLLNCPLI